MGSWSLPDPGRAYACRSLAVFVVVLAVSVVLLAVYVVVIAVSVVAGETVTVLVCAGYIDACTRGFGLSKGSLSVEQLAY